MPNGRAIAGTQERRDESADQPKNAKEFVHGTRPSHTHLDTSNPDAVQRWECNSPYCTEIEMRHPDNGGPVPIVQGYEPWKRA